MHVYEYVFLIKIGHTHTRTHAHTHTHTHTHALTHAYTSTHTHARTLARKRARTNTHTSTHLCYAVVELLHSVKIKIVTFRILTLIITLKLTLCTGTSGELHSKNKWGSEGPLKVLQFVPNTGPYLVLRGTPVEGASKDPHAMVF